MLMNNKLYIILFLFLFVVNFSYGQVTISGNNNATDDINYASPKKYTIGGITVSGVEFLDENVLKMLSGLRVGQEIEIPGEEITKAVKNLWKQGLFEDASITITSIIENKVFLNIYLAERPRLSKFSFKGISKNDADDIRNEINIVRGDVVNDNMIVRVTNKIKAFYGKKGFNNVDVNIDQIKDTAEINSLNLVINIDKKSKVKILHINVMGNKNLDAARIKNTFKETKEKGYFTAIDNLDTLFLSTVKKSVTFDMGEIIYNQYKYFFDNTNIRLFKASKYIEDKWIDDKALLVNKYNSLGYRDFKIVSDSVYPTGDKRNLLIDLAVSEGHKYYFRNITWIGNTKYSAEQLNAILKIQKGDVYNQKEMEANLNYNISGMDISSLYMDDGYLYFRVNPIEVNVENDSIDIVMQIIEGSQANVNKVKLVGNTKTNDYVAVREIRSIPGDLFNRSDIIRSQRELASLGYFNAEKINPEVEQNSNNDGTVDLKYNVEETSSDQLELSGGWAYSRIIGTVGVKFSNFSLRNIFNKDAWKPIPSGDGQSLSIRLQTYGTGYISTSVSFTEPWLGGKKPNAFSTTYYYSHYTNGYSKSSSYYGAFNQNGVIIGLGKRLKWPDDFFTLYQSANLIRYSLVNYTGIFAFDEAGNGTYYNLSYGISLSRSSTDQPFYPRRGSDFTVGVKITPPYSLFNHHTAAEYNDMSTENRYRWIEYYKWDIRMAWYQQLVGDLVLMVRSKYGFLGCYNNDLGITPFERYFLGGDGLSSYSNFDGREIIGFRGYTEESLTPNYYYDKDVGGTVYNKNTIELRYPLSLNPSATIYALAFFEAGNDWNKIKNFNPFNLYRSAGVGVRIYMPMFGLLGLDWGYGFDDVYGLPSANGSQFHFSINGSID